MNSKDLQKIQQILESMNERLNKMTLNSIYGDLNDIPEDELLYHLIDPELGNIEMNIIQMSLDDMLKIMTDKGDMTVIDAYKKFADKEQKNIVNFYRKNKNELEKYPIIIKDNLLVDGYHRLVASYLNKQPIKALNISQII